MAGHICNLALIDCENLQAIYVEDGCEMEISDLSLPESARIGPLPETMIGGVRVWDLKELRSIVVPDGVERIGSYWF